jgi:hypothetical protein
MSDQPWRTTKQADVPCGTCGKKGTCKVAPDGTAFQCWRDDGRVHQMNGHAKANGTGYVGAAHRKPAAGKASTPTTYPTVDAAIAAAGRSAPGGQLGTVAKYRQGDRSEAFRVARFDLPGGDKTFRPVHPVAGGWRIGDPAGPLPLYNLPDLPTSTDVYVCEGEKAADAAWSIGLPGTTSAHGSASAAKSDWSPLAGLDVTVLPDNDAPGEKYAAAVVSILTALNPPARVRVVRLPGLPPGGDVVEFIAARTDVEAAEVGAAIMSLAAATPVETAFGFFDATETLRPGPARPTAAPRSEPFAPFPLDELPTPLREYVENAAATIGCDPSFVALPLLAGCGQAIGTSRRVKLKRGWYEPPIIWTAIVGDSGSLKTPAIEVGTRHPKRFQEAAYAAHAKDQARHAEEVKAWKAMPKDVRGTEPAEPDACHRIVLGEATIEAAIDRLSAAPRGLLLVRDELAGWMGGFNQYKSKGGGDVAHWLECFGGRSITIDRKMGDPSTGARKTVYIPRASVCVTGGIQPGTLARLLSPEFFVSGFAARLFFAYPPKRPKRWTEDEIDPAVDGAVSGVFARLYSLVGQCDLAGQAEPVDVTLGHFAKGAWIEFVNRNGDEQHARGDEQEVAAWSKLEGGAARLALILHMVKVAAGDPAVRDNEIDHVSLESGIRLSRWFGHEAQRIYAALREPAEARDDRQLCEFIRARGGSITARDLQRSSASRYPTAAAADQTLTALADAGRGHWREPVPTGKPGRPPTRSFVLADDGEDLSDDVDDQTQSPSHDTMAENA